MPKKVVSTTKFHTVKKRMAGPSWKADCARMKKHS